MTSAPALNIERPETGTVELETSGVPEILIKSHHQLQQLKKYLVNHHQ